MKENSERPIPKGASLLFVVGSTILILSLIEYFVGMFSGGSFGLGNGPSYLALAFLFGFILDIIAGAWIFITGL